MRTKLEVRLDQRTKEEWTNFAKSYDWSLSELVRQSVRLVTSRPALLETDKEDTLRDQITNLREEVILSQTEILGQQQQQLELLTLFHQQQMDTISMEDRGDAPDLWKDEILEMARENPESLKTYQDLEVFLVGLFPQHNERIVDQKAYNSVISDLILEGLVRFNRRDHTFIWLVT